MINKGLVLISGKSASGKSASLRNINNPEGVIFLGCEAGKALPFSHKFQVGNIIDPLEVFKYFEYAETTTDVHTIVIDSLTFLMDMYESVHVLTSANTMKAWGDYAQYFKKLMQHYVADSSKNIIIIAHTSDVYNETDLVMETRVKVKGSIMNQGVEAYFTQVIGSKVLTLKELEEYKNPLLNITEEEEHLGFKYVFQTRMTSGGTKERIRAPIGMWPISHTYIDNDIQKVIDHTHDYYNPQEEKEDA